jgi:aldehyde:ferredoxin oxidoreductase
MVGGYYRARQWDENGYVPQRKLEELGIAGTAGVDDPAVRISR